MPEIRKINKLFRSIANEYEDVCLIGESYLQVEKLASYYGNNDEYHLPFNFSLTVNNLTASNIREAIMRAETAVPLWACSSWAFGNHDRSRVASREGFEKAKLVMMLLLTLNGTPTIYYGDELGMEDVIIPDNKVVDPWGIVTPSRGRDKVRTPMPWNNSDKGGFCDVDVEPWLPLNSDYMDRNIDSLSQDPNSILSMTRNLIALRRSSSTLREGRMELEEGSADEVRFLRATDTCTYRIQLNFGETPIECMPGEVLFATDEQYSSGQVRPCHGVVVRCVPVEQGPFEDSVRTGLA
jgi:alpha-glucosidase